MKVTHSQESGAKQPREVRAGGEGKKGRGLYHLAKGKKYTHLLLHTGWTLDYVKTVWQSKAKEEACAVAAIDNGLVFQHSPPLHRGNNSRTAEKEKISWPNVKTSKRATCWPKTMRNKQCICRTLVNFKGLCFLCVASTTTGSTNRRNSTVEKLRCLHSSSVSYRTKDHEKNRWCTCCTCQIENFLRETNRWTKHARARDNRFSASRASRIPRASRAHSVHSCLSHFRLLTEV